MGVPLRGENLGGSAVATLACHSKERRACGLVNRNRVANWRHSGLVIHHLMILGNRSQENLQHLSGRQALRGRGWAAVAASL